MISNKRTRILLTIVVGVTILIASASLIIILLQNSPKAPKGVSVLISEDGFEPHTLTIPKGTAVIWRNDDTESHRVAANPFPSHSELPELDSGNNIPPGGDYSFTFEKSGTFNYHDELAPNNNATIVVR
jgi:plastocyanin